MDRILELWRTFSPLYKLAIAGALLLLLLLASGLVGGLVSKIKDARFDKEITQAKKERQNETERANLAEKRATELEAEKQKYEIVLEVAGERAKVAMQKVSNAEKQFVLDSDHINGIADVCQHYHELRASLGLAPKQCPAEDR